MKQQQLFRELIPLADHELVIDNFAGGGGASTGIARALGRPVDIAINHDPDAIKMHMANHPDTVHYCESVWDVDPREVTKGRPVGLVWLSPDCKHFSKAKGGKPVEKKIRGLAWVALRWAATVKPRVIILENVEEFKTWGPLIAQKDKETGRLLKKVPYYGNDNRVLYDVVVSEPGEVVPPELLVMIPDPKRKGHTFNSFVNALRYQGYQVEWRELRACDYGAPTSRNRFFLVARCDGQAIVWPEPTHGDPKNAAVKSGKLLPWRTAAEIIDWSLPCPSIFERKKPLAENTMRRIARGIFKFVIDNPEPFIIKIQQNSVVQSLDEPLHTVMAGATRFGLVSPYIARIGQTGFSGDRMQYPMDQPLTTIVTKAEHLLVAPVISRQFGKSIGHEVTDPLGTITAGGGGKSQLVAAFLSQYHGEKSPNEVRGQMPGEPIQTIDTSNRYSLVTSHLIKLRGTCQHGQSVTEPMPTVTAGGFHIGEVRAFLLKYYGTNIGQTCDEPLQTITAKHRFGLVTVHGVDYQIVDIGMRMLEPRELFNAQGFPASYIIDQNYTGKPYPKSAQVARCGNSVPPDLADALTRVNVPEMCRVAA